MIKKIALLLISMLLFSCASVTTLLQPEWTVNTPKIVGSVVYVGHGIGDTQDNAKDRAYLEILSQLGSDLGYDIASVHFRELISTDEIESLSTYITDQYVYQQSNGEWHYYVMARTSQSALLDSRSPEYISLMQREASISEKLEESLELYKENKDIDAINKVLEALVISLDGDVNNPEYTPESLLDKAIGYADNLKITLSKEERDAIGVTVKVKRTKGFFYPVVEYANIKASYQMMNTEGALIPSTFACRTDNRGRFRYTNTNPYTVREGDIVFSISLSSELLNEIAYKAGNDFTNRLLDVLDSKSVVYSYSAKSPYSQKDTLIVYALYDEDGNTIFYDSFEKALRDYFKKARLEEFPIVQEEGDEFEDIYYTLIEKYPQYKYFVIIRAGVVGFVATPTEIHARSDGRVAFYDKSSEEAFLIQDSYMVGCGEDYYSASENALEKEARIIAGRLLEEL